MDSQWFFGKHGFVLRDATPLPLIPCKGALARKGIRLVGLQAIPAAGPMGFANAVRGYRMDDNGTGRVWTFAQVLEAAQ